MQWKLNEKHESWTENFVFNGGRAFKKIMPENIEILKHETFCCNQWYVYVALLKKSVWAIWAHHFLDYPPEIIFTFSCYAFYRASKHLSPEIIFLPSYIQNIQTFNLRINWHIFQIPNSARGDGKNDTFRENFPSATFIYGRPKMWNNQILKLCCDEQPSGKIYDLWISDV